MWASCPVRTWRWHRRKILEFVGDMRRRDTPNLLLGGQSLLMNDVLRRLLQRTRLNYKLRSTVVVRQALYAENNVIHCLVYNGAHLHFSTVLLMNPEAILTSFIIEKVFGKEPGCCNWWRLPPFILSGGNSVPHAFIRDLVSCSSCFASHSLTPLIVALLVAHNRDRRVSRCKPWALVADNNRVIVFNNSMLRPALRLWNNGVDVVLFIAYCEAFNDCSFLV